MAYREAVGYIEQMNPGFVAAVAQEYLRTKEVIKSLLPTIAGPPGEVERLRESAELVEGLYFVFEKAGLALLDYASAQRRAVARAKDGAAAEDSLKALSRRDARDEVRDTAEALWQYAVGAYDEAIRLETEARHDTVNRLIAAYLLLPEFHAGSALTEYLIRTVPTPPDGSDRYRLGPAAEPPMAFGHDFPYHPDAEPTPADHASWIRWTAFLRTAQASGHLDDAVAAYAHYRDGTGTPLRIDYEKAYAQDSGIRAVADAEIASAKREAERIFSQTGQSAFQMTGDATAASDLVPDVYPATENWQKTLGGYFVYGTSEVVVNGDHFAMRIVVHAEDLYNFNSGRSDVPTGVPDSENGRFAELGWAKEFRASGELKRTVIWKIGETQSVAEAPLHDRSRQLSA